jgi:hypothetical protein
VRPSLRNRHRLLLDQASVTVRSYFVAKATGADRAFDDLRTQAVIEARMLVIELGGPAMFVASCGH